MPVREAEAFSVFDECVPPCNASGGHKSAGFTHNIVRGAEDLATKKFSLVTKWTVPTTFS